MASSSALEIAISSVPPALELATETAEPGLAAPRERALSPTCRVSSSIAAAPRELDPVRDAELILSSVRDAEWTLDMSLLARNLTPHGRMVIGLGQRQTAAPGTPFLQQRGRSRSRSITPTLPIGRAIERVPTTAAEMALIRQIEAADRIAGIRRVWD